MRGQLVQYVNLLFAGTENTAEIRQEILQNTLDRYDDLIAQGKTPEAAYRLTIAGIGDINELLDNPKASPKFTAEPEKKETALWQKLLRAVAVMLYIICPIPLFILQDEIGLCALLAVVGIATALIVLASKGGNEASGGETPREMTPKSSLKKGISSLVWAVGLGIYFLLSFSTGAWYITWIIFPILGAVEGLIKAIVDLKEAE